MTKKIYQKKHHKGISNTFSGCGDYKMKPFGLKAWKYVYKKDRRTNPAIFSEDAYSIINKKKARQENKKIIEEEMIYEIEKYDD